MNRLHRQERINTCAVASLRTVLDLQFGINLPERILEAFGTTAALPIRHVGTNTTELRRIVNRASEAYNLIGRWRLRVRRHGTRTQLARQLALGHYPMVSVQMVELHMMVVTELPPGQVVLFEPRTGALETWEWRTFLAQWAESRWFAVVLDGVIYDKA